MNFILFCAAGCVCVGVPYILAFDPYDLWHSVIAGIGGGIVYLAALVVISRKQFGSNKEAFFIGAICLGLAGGYASYAATQYRMSHYRHDILLRIRTAIGSGIIASDKIPESMLPVLSVYYRQRPDAGRPMVTVFKEMYGDALANGTFNRYMRADVTTDAVTFVSFDGDSVVHYICVDTVARGWKPDYQNRSGHTGKLQYRAVLSRKGVDYERVN